MLLVLGGLVTVIWDCVLQPWLSFHHRFDDITESLTSCHSPPSALTFQISTHISSGHGYLDGGPVVILLRDYVVQPG